VATAFAFGSCHDFKLLKNSKTNLHPDTEGLYDKGYQGQQKRHKKTKLPHKKSKKKPLTKEQKSENKIQAKARVIVENVIRRLKIFRILKHDYRNRRKRYGLRFNLIAAIYNMGLDMKL
jgi:hypothetical protein